MSRQHVVLLTIALLAALVIGWQAQDAVRAGSAERDGVFIHISSGPADPHAVLMGLKMATVMAGDRDVLIYFDLKGVEVVLKDAPDITHPAFDAARTQIKALLDRGVPLYVCPSCLKAAGREAADVTPGVKIADKDAFFGFTKGRILALDY